MTAGLQPPVGRVTSLWRYPVKSMGGEELARCRLGPDGVAGDRRFALVDRETGRVVSAKNPRKWPHLLSLSARLDESASGPALQVLLPDGRVVGGDDPGADSLLSVALGRAVSLCRAPPAGAAIEVHWPEIDGLPAAGTDAEEVLPAGSFFDLAPLHLLTTATLRELARHHPGGRFDPRRFRPNLVIDTPGKDGFVEGGWVGRTLRIGEAVRLRATSLCSRCVMTTVAQSGIPADPEVLKTAVRGNGARVGVYAHVIRSGEVARGNAVEIE